MEHESDTTDTSTRRRVLGMAGGVLFAGASTFGSALARTPDTTESGARTRALAAHDDVTAMDSAMGSRDGRTAAQSRDSRPSDRRDVVIEHDGRRFTVEPLVGDTAVTERYHYQVPDQFVSKANGAVGGGELHFTGTGFDDLRRDDTTITFLYDGPEGLSLVVVHDDDGESPHGGGAVSWTITGLPKNGRWVVKDDLYRNPGTGELASTNYDRWNVSGRKHVIDWTWGGTKTDGGAFRGPGDGFDVTIDAAFNEDAALFGQYYEGRITDWVLYSGDRSDPTSIPLCRKEPLHLETK